MDVCLSCDGCLSSRQSTFQCENISHFLPVWHKKSLSRLLLGGGAVFTKWSGLEFKYSQSHSWNSPLTHQRKSWHVCTAFWIVKHSVAFWFTHLANKCISLIVSYVIFLCCQVEAVKCFYSSCCLIITGADTCAGNPAAPLFIHHRHMYLCPT